MGFRIIVYNNIITKFYTFQAERERVFLKSCTILISTHNWGRRRRRGGWRLQICLQWHSHWQSYSRAPDTIFQYLRQSHCCCSSQLLLASSFNFNFPEICIDNVWSVYQFTKGAFEAIAYLYILYFEPNLPLDFKDVLAFFYSQWV